MKSHLTIDDFLARERKIAEAKVAKDRAAEAAMLRRDAAAQRFAGLYPMFAAEVERKLHETVVTTLERVPAWDVATRARIEQSRRDAFNQTMQNARIALRKKKKADAA
jgi:hypothetical protein